MSGSARWARGVDGTHGPIVRGLKAAGWTVHYLAVRGRGGRGLPDLLLGGFGLTVLVEVKRLPLEELRPRNLREKLRLEEQAEWRARWRGGPVLVAWALAPLLAELDALRAAAATNGCPREACS